MSLDIEQDLQRIADQERALVLPRFEENVAWQLGVALCQAAFRRAAGIAIEIRRGEQLLFFHTMQGTTAANADWARRKGNLVHLTQRSSYAFHLEQLGQGRNVLERMGLPPRDYVASGGSFPVRTRDSGFIGSVTVSGLPQREDHGLVVEVLALHLELDPAELALTHVPT